MPVRRLESVTVFNRLCMKRSFCFSALVSFLPLLSSCEVSESTLSGHVNHGYLSSYGKNLMENSVIRSSAVIDDILDIQAFLRLPDSEQNSDANYAMRSRIISKDKTGEIEVGDYGVIRISGSGIDVPGGEWRSGSWAVSCVGDGHWTMKVLEEKWFSIFTSIEYAADIRSDASAPKKYVVAVTDGMAYDSGDSAMGMTFRTEKDFSIDRSADNADGVFFAEVVKAGTVLDWVRVTAASRIGEGYRITVTSSRQ